MGNDIRNDKTNEGHKMPTAERVNFDMTEYLERMERYIEELKGLPREEAVLAARKNLLAAGIIDENGNLTGYYEM